MISLLLIAIGSANAFNPNDYISVPFLKFPDDLSENVLLIENWTDYVFASIYIGIFYYTMYVGISELFVRTHPGYNLQKRQIQTKEERRRGFKALFFVILCTTFTIWKIVPKLPYYGYYETHDLTITDLVIQIVVYLFVFDLWFYFTHIVGHKPFFWKHFHGEHHEFVEPGAYGQDAVHPIEALIQGPIGHFLPTLFFPYHPAVHHLFGLLTSIYAQFAHDGRWDPAGHTIHHYYFSCNYSIWGFSDYIFNTKYSPKNYPVTYIPSWMKKQE